MVRKIFVFGAGVLGSLYAGKLHQAGYEVTLLARGNRLAELKRMVCCSKKMAVIQ